MEKLHGLSFPVQLEGGSVINPTINQSIESNVKVALNWQPNTRFFMPGFGTDLERFIGEPNDTTSHMLIRRKIYDVISRYELRASIERIEFGNDLESLRINLQMKVNDTQELILMTL